MNDVFFDYLNDFVSIYIDNILIYSNFKKKHVEHVKKMLQRLRDADLQVDIDKCEFFVHEIKYLDLIVDRDEIKMNSEKIETILQWATSQIFKQIQEFLDFCNFYRRFIKNFAKIVKSLIKLTLKDVSFIWNEACKAALKLLKRTVIETSILAHFDLKKQIYIKRLFEFRVCRSLITNEEEWWTSSRDIFFKESRFDRMQLRNLWQRIVDDSEMLWAMKIWVVVHEIECVRQDIDRS
jgi:hypothetical protein